MERLCGQRLAVSAAVPYLVDSLGVQSWIANTPGAVRGSAQCGYEESGGWFASRA